MEKKQKLIGISGVYAWLVNDIIKYIGSAKGDLETRYSNHSSNLLHNKHTNKELQELYNTYGKGAFKFYILDLCDADSCLELEKLYMLIHQDTIVKQNKIIKLNRKVRTAEEQQKLSEKLSKANSGKNNPNARLTEQDVLDIIMLKQQKVDPKLISEQFNISVSHVLKIGKSRWGNLVS